MWIYFLEAIVFSVWYYYACMKGDFRNTNIKKVLQPVNVLAVVLLAIGMCFFVNFQMPIVNLVLPDNIVQQYNSMMESAGFGVELIPTIICLTLAPIGEEFLFRGVLFYYLTRVFELKFPKRTAFWGANIIQAFLFGLFHMNPIQGGYAFLIGLVLGFLYYQYKSVLPALIVHVVNNFLSAFIWPIVIEYLPQSNEMYTVGAGLSLCVVVLGMMLNIVNNDTV